MYRRGHNIGSWGNSSNAWPSSGSSDQKLAPVKQLGNGMVASQGRILSQQTYNNIIGTNNNPKKK